SASIAAEGAHSPPLGTPPVPTAKGMRGARRLGTGSALNVQSAGVSIASPDESSCVTHPSGGDADRFGSDVGEAEDPGPTVPPRPPRNSRGRATPATITTRSPAMDAWARLRRERARVAT